MRPEDKQNYNIEFAGDNQPKRIRNREPTPEVQKGYQKPENSGINGSLIGQSKLVTKGDKSTLVSMVQFKEWAEKDEIEPDVNRIEVNKPKESDLMNTTLTSNPQAFYVKNTLKELELSDYFKAEGAQKYRMDDGSIYQGEIKNGTRHGKGKMVCTDGSYYDGEWFSGLYHGQGRYINVSGDIYQGDWLQGKREGKGLQQNKDGYLYRGEWRNDLQHGRGHERDQKGVIYEGEFKAGLKEGKGELSDQANGWIIVGQFANNSANGRGK